MSLPLSLILALVLMACEWFYVQSFFKSVEPLIIARVERFFGIEIGFGFFHHWEVRQTAPDLPLLARLLVSLAVFGIQLTMMVCFAMGFFVLIGLIFGPAILFHLRRST